jgi:hypothetical protein
MHKKIVWSIIIIFSVLTPAHFAISQDASNWGGVKQEFINQSKSNNDIKRITITRKLVQCINPKVESEAVELLSNHLVEELNRSKNGAAEERVNINVLDACIEGFRKMTTEKAIELLIKKAADPKLYWRHRFYIIYSFSVFKQDKIIETLLGLINDKSWPIQMISFDILSEHCTPLAIQSACKMLGDDIRWEVKLSAVNYLKAVKSPESVKYIKKAIITSKHMESQILSALLDLLDQLPQEESESKTEDEKATKSVIDLGEYYKIKIRSDRIVFVIDVSGSMQWETQKDEPETPPGPAQKPVITGAAQNGADKDNEPVPEELKKAKENNDRRPIRMRIDAVKKETINAIYHLNSRVYFGIIYYSHGVTFWKTDLIPANYENKLGAIKSLELQGPLGGTNIYDALEGAYKLTITPPDTEPADPNKINPTKISILSDISGADTIFLLTDGQPNFGKLVEPDDIVDDIRKLNQTRRVKINTIAVGVSDPKNEDSKDYTLVNIKLMRQIAEVTGGIFVDKTKVRYVK